MVSFQQHMEHSHGLPRCPAGRGSSAGRAFRDFHLPRLLQGADSQNVAPCRAHWSAVTVGDRHDFLHEKWWLWGDHEDFMSFVFFFCWDLVKHRGDLIYFMRNPTISGEHNGRYSWQYDTILCDVGVCLKFQDMACLKDMVHVNVKYGDEW